METKPTFLNKVKQLVDYKIDGALSKAKESKSNKYVVKRRSIFVDDLTAVDQGGYLDKATLVPFEVLKQMSDRDMAVTAVINKIVNRCSAFSRKQKDRYSMGFLVSKRDRDAEITPEEEEEIKMCEEFFAYTGFVADGRPRSEIRNLDVFMRLIVKDALRYNQIGVELIPQKQDASKLSYMIPVDGSSIRLAVKNLKEKYKSAKELFFMEDMSVTDGKKYSDRELDFSKLDKELSENKLRYIQVWKNQKYAAWTDDEFIYKQRSPSNEIGNQGYATGELEWLINTIASHRIAESHNEIFFKQGHGNNGILNIKSEMTEEDLQGVRRMFQRLAQGVRNAWRQIIFNAPGGIEWIQMSSMNNRDMEWHEWMMYLIKLICAVYGMNPSEINFDISKDNTGALGDSGKRNEVQLKDTHNTILRPLLHWIEDIFNDEIMPRLGKDLHKKYVFEFVGLDAIDPGLELERIKQKVTTIYTINDVRKEQKMDPLGEEGDIILDSNFVQWKIALKNTGMGSPEGGGGMPSEDIGGEAEITDEDLEGLFATNKEEATKALTVVKDKIAKAKKPIKVEYYR